MLLCRTSLVPYFLRSPANRHLHVCRVVHSKPTTESKGTAPKPQGIKDGKAPMQQTRIDDKKPADQQTSTDGGRTNEQDPEKIEYFGNTRFPRPRAKPRRTITPGDAVGQTEPAVRRERQPLKQQMEQKMRDVLSPEKNLETRAKIIHDIGHSYFQDIVDLRNNGDKLFEAPSQLIKSGRARYLPNLEGKTLTGVSTDVVDLCRNKTTLLSVEFTKFAEKHTQSFVGVFEKAFADAKNVQLVQANIEENWAKAMVLKLCLPYLRRSMPKHRHANYLVHYGDVEPLRKALGIANPLIGYVFLIDADTRVRWYANGVAVKSEAETMVRLTRSLAKI
ncbi:Mitochondrial ATPase complex subunit atp10 [Coemansia sp. RSA 988]|nr:Mitochondrial ATPase complex subunit atp10 [Coemansia sp. RSA 988]